MGEVKFIEKAKRHEVESIFAFHPKRTNHYWNYCLDFLLGLLVLSENYIPLAMATTVAFGISITGLMLDLPKKEVLSH